jgi:hypothetical protein
MKANSQTSDSYKNFIPRSKLLKDRNGDLLADPCNSLNKRKTYFSHFLNVHIFIEVRQMIIHTAEPVVPGSGRLEVEIAVPKLKKYKSLSSDQIPAKLIQAGE